MLQMVAEKYNQSSMDNEGIGMNGDALKSKFERMANLKMQTDGILPTAGETGKEDFQTDTVSCF